MKSFDTNTSGMPTEKTVLGRNEIRRGSKPLVEKRRRARINRGLAELQALVLDGKKKEGLRNSRVEKADILEMAVRYLKSLQQQQVSSEPIANGKFQTGFKECMKEALRFFDKLGYPDTLRTRLHTHLQRCLRNVKEIENSHFTSKPTLLNVTTEERYLCTGVSSESHGTTSDMDDIIGTGVQRDIDSCTPTSTDTGDQFDGVPCRLIPDKIAFVYPTQPYNMYSSLVMMSEFSSETKFPRRLLMTPESSASHSDDDISSSASSSVQCNFGAQDISDSDDLNPVVEPPQYQMVHNEKGAVGVVEPSEGSVWRPW